MTRLHKRPPPESSIETLLIVSDLQIPFEDPAAVAVMLKVSADLQPDYLYLNGDISDFYAISSHLPDPRRNLVDELEITKRFLDDIMDATPNATRFFIEGNHEDRLRKYLISHASALVGNQAVTVDGQLGLTRRGFTQVAYPHGVLHKTLYVVHGDLVSKHSAYTAKQMLDHYGISGISGHTHRLGSHYKTTLGGPLGWWENGCLCNLDLDYDDKPNWMQGFSIVTFIGNRFWVEQVVIHEGKAIWRGKLYHG